MYFGCRDVSVRQLNKIRRFVALASDQKPLEQELVRAVDTGKRNKESVFCLGVKKSDEKNTVPSQVSCPHCNWP